MPGLLPHIDPDGLLEFSVVYTDRALNHMSKRFGGVMTDISRMLKTVYGAHSVALVPGSGTFGMESVARQFATNQQAMLETEAYGFGKVREEQIALGREVRSLLLEHGFPSVAAPGFEAPGVVVSYTTDPEIQNSKKFLALGLQTAAGVPLQCDEPADFSTFRMGLFGLDKWHQVPRTLQILRDALETIAPKTKLAA